jgi:hypothetical protein
MPFFSSQSTIGVSARSHESSRRTPVIQTS